MEPQTTKLGRLIDAEHAARGESALRLLFSGTEAFAAHLKSSLETPYINALSEKVLRWAGADPRANWVFATTRVLADSPGKAMSAEHERLIDQIAKVLPAAQSEVLIV